MTLRVASVFSNAAQIIDGATSNERSVPIICRSIGETIFIIYAWDRPSASGRNKYWHDPGGGHSTTAALASGYVIVGSMYLSTSCFLARQWPQIFAKSLGKTHRMTYVLAHFLILYLHTFWYYGCRVFQLSPVYTCCYKRHYRGAHGQRIRHLPNLQTHGRSVECGRRWSFLRPQDRHRRQEKGIVWRHLNQHNLISCVPLHGDVIAPFYITTSCPYLTYQPWVWSYYHRCVQ